ncbi:MAG: hypothetical protein V4702_04065 [Patescibacteria group bacterium]
MINISVLGKESQLSKLDAPIRVRGRARIFLAALTVASALGGCNSGGSEEAGCEPFTIYAQHKWPPDGAALRSEPNKDAPQIAGVEGPDPILVDGFVKAAEPTYPNNPDPFKGEYWYHATEPEEGWVNSAAVRAIPLKHEEFDPTGLDPNGGPPAPLPKECELTSAA